MENPVIETRTEFEVRRHLADVCVVGGGMAGLCAAITSARRGAKTLLMQDRPVLGGNASSEIRMWICGAHGEHNQETGLLEEILLENCLYNPSLNYSMWDHVLYDMAARQAGLELLLNTSCLDAKMDGDRIASIEGWQLTSQTRHVVEAGVFIDCSGDSVLAVPTGAEVRWGRESSAEFGEDIEPAHADRRTMGNSILIQIRYANTPHPFTPPDWAWRIDRPEDLPYRINGVKGANFWWMEIGGCSDTIHDAEAIRDDLLKLAYGVWDYLKNRCPDRAETENWAIEWIGSLPGKRENRRYVGPHIMTQHDVAAGGPFDDIVAYGGWTMDDHHPAGIFYPDKPTIFHPAPSPFGIPYRSLYSRNVKNLMFAGRNISVTHAALSATRVMATCAVIGQATGTAAALCAKHGCLPADISEPDNVRALQEALMDDDAWLPGLVRRPSTLAREARLSGGGMDAELLLDGMDRNRPGENHAWEAVPGDAVVFEWDNPRKIGGLRCVFDSDLNDRKKMPCSYPQEGNRSLVPETLVRDFRVETRDASGEWTVVGEVSDNYQRLVRVAFEVETTALRFTPLRTWGSERVRVFGCEPVDVFEAVAPTKRQRPTFKKLRAERMRCNPEDFIDPAKATN